MTRSIRPTVLIVSYNASDLPRVRGVLESAGVEVATATTRDAAFETVYASPPHCLILDGNDPSAGPCSLLEALKSDNLYGHLPTILLVTQEDLAKGIDWSQIPADDYMVKPFDDTELLSRIRISMARAQRDINANPLTGLPGNLTIMREAEKRLEKSEPFAMAYLDIDNFKPFNDKYGFARGDEVLRMTARIIVNTVRTLDSHDTYVGHIGGDDFVFMTPCHLMSRTCRHIIDDFDRIVPNFYDEEDRLAGAIQSVDRRGNPQTFPLVSVSIAVVDTSTVEINHLADLSARTAEVKHFTKQLSGSNYLVDRRKLGG